MGNNFNGCFSYGLLPAAFPINFIMIPRSNFTPNDKTLTVLKVRVLTVQQIRAKNRQLKPHGKHCLLPKWKLWALFTN